MGTGLLPPLGRRRGRLLHRRELTGVEALALDLDVLAALGVVGALRVLVEEDDARVLGPAPAALRELTQRVTGRAAAASTQGRRRLLHAGRRQERARVLDQAGQQVEVAPEDVCRRWLHGQCGTAAVLLEDLDAGHLVRRDLCVGRTEPDPVVERTAPRWTGTGQCRLPVVVDVGLAGRVEVHRL